jgi:triacylglycerol esterase/lipase EstA (alpha/beta hydrolase family)
MFSVPERSPVMRLAPRPTCTSRAAGTGIRAAGVAVALLLIASALGAGASGAASPSPDLPQGTILNGLATELTNPGGAPPGMNVPCTLTSAHPFPVVLVAGTIANENVSWQSLSPALADEGYCVYGFNFGATPITNGRFFGLGDIPTSAQALATFVSAVLSLTHASKVDIVGHSQGGMMPRYYMKFLGGAAKVHMLVGLAPSNHGTTLDGFTTLTSLFGANLNTEGDCEACTQQLVGSTFLAGLNAGGDTQPGPKYVVIESRYDEVVTPYTSAFLSGPKVQNILLQNQCATDFSEHLGILYDPIAQQDVLNALGADDPSFVPTCSFVPPGIG